MKRLLLIDAYAMIYRAYYAFIKAPRKTSKGENTSAAFGFVIALDDLINRLQPTHLAVAFDPHDKTFRHEAYPAYKAQRQATPEDILTAVPIIQDILKARRIKTLLVPGFEADDIIGTLAMQAQKADFEVFMATPDKDYAQLVSENVYMYRPRHTGGWEQMGVQSVCDKYGLQDPKQVIDLLALMGDTADNIPGCVGVGEKTAVSLIQTYGSIENLLQNTDSLKGALQRKVVEQAEAIRFSRFLTTIRLDVPLNLTWDELAVQAPCMEELVPLYSRWEFRSLLKKQVNEASQTALTDLPLEPKKAPSGQLDLFGTAPQPPATAVQTGASADLFADLDTVQPLQIQVVQGVPSGLSPVAVMFENDSFYFATEHNTVYQSAHNEAVEHLLADETVLKITPDYKHFLHQWGRPIAGTVFDVTVAHYLIQPEMTHTIEALAEIYLRQSIDHSVEQRLAAAYRLYPLLQKELQQGGLMNLFETVEMPLVPVLYRMEKAGVRFDRAVLQEASVSLNQVLKGLEQEIEQLAGQHFNINSPKQVGEILFEGLHLDPKAKKTKQGQYSTSEEVLLALQDRHPIVGKILDYRGCKKLLSTYIEALPNLIEPDGKIHTTYNQTVTATGRLSSSNPNLQNLPIREERGSIIRKAVIADEGCVFLSADYSQIELRLMAHFSQDEHLVRAFQEGQDIHKATAAKIFAIPIEQVTPAMRRKAKTANFGIIYGISAFGLSQQLRAPRKEAQQLIDDYFVAFAGVKQFIEQMKQKAKQDGFVETLLGRKRFLPDINSRNATVRNFAERNAVNAPIQGTAADIIKIAMIRIDQRLEAEHLQAQMIMQVHDELNFNVPIGEVEKVRQIVVQEMQEAAHLSVPLIAECGVGENWLVAH